MCNGNDFDHLRVPSPSVIQLWKNITSHSDVTHLEHIAHTIDIFGESLSSGSCLDVPNEDNDCVVKLVNH